MGVQTPSEKLPDLRSVGIKFPGQASVVFVQQLFHYYFEILSETSAISPDTSGVSMLIRYQQKASVLIDQLHRANLLSPCIDLIILRQPSHTAISRLSAGDRRGEILSTQLYHAFRSAEPMWVAYFNDLPNVRPIVEARSDAEYKTAASLVCMTAQRYLWNAVFSKHSLVSWSRWIQRLVLALEGYEFWDESAAAFIREHNDNNQFYHLVILLCSLSTSWTPPDLTMEELDQHIRDQDVVDLLNASRILTDLNLYASGDYSSAQTVPFQTMRVLAGKGPTYSRTTSLLMQLAPLTQWCTIPDLFEEDAPITDTLTELLETVRHYTQRRISNVSSESTLLCLEELPAEPIEEHEAVDINEIIITRYRDTSPNAVIRASLQAPDPSSGDVSSMRNFTREITKLLRPLMKTAFDVRNSGLLSSCEPYQMAMIHSIRYCRAQPPDRKKPPGVVILGNASGFVARAYLELFSRDIVIAISCDARQVAGSMVPVLGGSGYRIPPDLVSASLDPDKRNRLMFQHGIDGDISNQQPLLSHDLRLKILGASIRLFFLDLTSEDPTQQAEVIKRAVRLQRQTQNLGVPLRCIWRLNSISIDSLIRLLSLGSSCSMKIVGQEYMTTPALLCTIRVTNLPALTTANASLPLVLRTAVSQMVVSASWIGSGYGRIAADELLTDLRVTSSIQLAHLVPMPAALTDFHPSCVCQLPRELDEKIGPRSTDQLREIFDAQQQGPRCIEALQEELVKIKVIFQTLGLQLCLSESGGDLFWQMAMNSFLGAYRIFFPLAFQGAGQIVGDKSMHRASDLTPDGHSITISRHNFVVQVKHLSIDILHEFNVGISKGYDLFLACGYIRTLTGVDTEARHHALERFWEGLECHQCCYRVPTQDILEGLAYRRKQLTLWRQREFKDQILVDSDLRERTPSPFEHDERDRQGSSVYVLGSPVYGQVDSPEYDVPASPPADPQSPS